MNKGVRLYQDGQHVKTLPVRLVGAALRIDFVTQSTQKRPSELERFKLEEYIWRNSLQWKAPVVVYGLIKNKTVSAAIAEQYPGNAGGTLVRYVFMYGKNNIRVIVPEKLFRLWPGRVITKKEMI